jgi:hypothetical protein
LQERRRTKGRKFGERRKGERGEEVGGKGKEGGRKELRAKILELKM